MGETEAMQLEEAFGDHLQCWHETLCGPPCAGFGMGASLLCVWSHGQGIWWYVYFTPTGRDFIVAVVFE